MPWKKLGATVLAVLMTSTACGGAARPSTVAARVKPAAPADPRPQLRRLEASTHRHIGAFALDTGTGRAVGYRINELFPTLSTWKAMETAAILHRGRNLDRVIHWKPSQEVDGSPITKGHGKEGMTVARLIAATMSVSDNTAANVLLGQVGGTAGVTRYYRSLNDKVSRLDRVEPELNDWKPGELRDTTTPANMARDLTAVTVGKALTPADRTKLIAWMRGCKTGDNRIRAGLPQNWQVGDKTGTGSDFGGANDIAITWPPSHAPLIIAVYTYGKKGAPADEKAIASTASILARSLVQQ